MSTLKNMLNTLAGATPAEAQLLVQLVQALGMGTPQSAAVTAPEPTPVNTPVTPAPVKASSTGRERALKAHRTRKLQRESDNILIEACMGGKDPLKALYTALADGKAEFTQVNRCLREVTRRLAARKAHATRKAQAIDAVGVPPVKPEPTPVTAPVEALPVNFTARHTVPTPAQDQPTVKVTARRSGKGKGKGKRSRKAA